MQIYEIHEDKYSYCEVVEVLLMLDKIQKYFTKNYPNLYIVNIRSTTYINLNAGPCRLSHHDFDVLAKFGWKSWFIESDEDGNLIISY